jgi:hypothetical protein
MSDLLIERHPVHAEFIGGEIVSSGVAFEDYTRMSTQLLQKLNSNRRLVAPAWAYNDDPLLTVLTRAMEERALISRMLQTGTTKEKLERAQQKLEKMRPELTARIDKLCTLFVAAKRDGDHDIVASLGVQVEALDTQIRLLSDIPKILAGVVYFYWRCGFDSVQTGQQLGIKPPHVRQLLSRLLESAKALGYPPPEEIAKQPRRSDKGRHRVSSPGWK